MWLDQRVVLNAAVYYNKARDLQESIFLGSGAAASSVRNAGKATIYGAELEGQIALWSGSRLGFNYAYLHTKYDEFMDAGVAVADNRAFVHAPKHRPNLYLDMRLARFGWAVRRVVIDSAKLAMVHGRRSGR